MSDVEYLIDIAAKATGVDAGAAQLADLAAQLTGVGASAHVFDAAIAAVESELESAAAATKATASALSDGEAKYKQLETAANRAALALEKAGQKSSGSVPADLKSKADAAAAALKTEASSLDLLRTKAAGAVSAQDKLGTTLKNLQAGAKQAGKQDALAKGTGKINEMGEAFGKLGGPLGRAGQQVLGFFTGIEKLGASAGGAAGPVGAIAVAAVALTAAVLAAAAAIGVAVVQTTIWGVKLADSARNAALNLAVIQKTTPALSGLGAILPTIAAKTGLANDKIEELGQQLATAKIKAADMPAALKAVATAEAAGAGQTYISKLVSDLQTGKKTAAAMAAEVEAKFGGIVAKRLLSLDAQSTKLKTNLAATFGGLDIEPLLKALSELVGLFDKNSVSGRVMKTVFEAVFQPIVNGLAKSAPLLKGFLLGIEIGALKVYLAFKPVIKAASELFGESAPDLKTGLEIAVFLGKALAAALATVVAGVALVAAAIAIPVIAFQKLYAAGSIAWETVKAGAAEAVAFLESVSLEDIGASMLQGLADGITGGASKVIAALGGVVTNAIGAAKQKLGIASPSKVFAKLGAFTAEGFAGGVDDGAGDAQAAVQSMVAPPAAGGRGAGGGVTVGNVTFNITGRDADEIAQKVKEILLSIIEGDITIMGGPPAPAT